MIVTFVTLSVLIILSVIVSYITYRIVKRAGRGPPKTLVVSRGISENYKSTSENKKRQVIGMINCEYCGSLMSQNATVCPNCGAPRKE